MKLKNGLSLVLALVLAAQLCLPVGATVAGTPAADLGAGEIVSTHRNQHTAEVPEASAVPELPEMPEVPAETAVPEEPELPDLDASAEGLAELTATGVIDISSPDNYIVITDTGYSIGGKVETPYTGPYVLDGKNVQIEQTNATFTEVTSYFTAISHIVVKNTNGTPIEITLQNVKIDLSSVGKCAFSIYSGKVNLTLKGENILSSGSNLAALRVGAGKSLTITAESTGSLNATGDSKAAPNSKSAAGIGGNYMEAGGEITISGGTVNIDGAIGGVSGSDPGTFSTTANGNAAIFARSISDQSGKAGWNGIIFEDRFGKMYGSSVTLCANVVIPKYTILVVDYGQSLTIPNTITFRNEGTIWNGGTILGNVVGLDPRVLGKINISDQSDYVVITDTGYSLRGGHEVPYKGTYTLLGKATSSEASRNHITVDNKSAKPIPIHFNNLSVDVSSGNRCPFAIVSGGADVTLFGTNTLLGAEDFPGLQVESGKSLTITAESTGSLTATGGAYTIGSTGGGAGIGGSNKGAGGNITINGGTVTATGDDYGAGIGGGDKGAGGNITINGGTVTATGSYGGGAGIGGGSGGSGGNITINGGTVSATGKTNGGAGIGSGRVSAGESVITITGGTVTATCTGGGGAGIGSGYGSHGENVTIRGGTVTATGSSGAAGIGGSEPTQSSFSTGTDGNVLIFTTSISDQSKKDLWRGIVFEGNTGSVCGSVTLAKDFTIMQGQTLIIGGGSTLIIPGGGGVRLQNNGTIINGGTIQGLVSGIQPITGKKIDISDPSKMVVITDKGYRIGDDPHVPYVGPYTLTGTAGTQMTQNHITIDSISAKPLDITLSGVKITTTLKEAVPFTVKQGKVFLTLVGQNELVSHGERCPALAVKNEGDLTITRASTGSLYACGYGSRSPGIGEADISENKNASNGIICINGGNIIVYGGEYAPGIGGNGPSDKAITINGGNVTAHGGKSDSGIGGSERGAPINITGGTVEAYGGTGAAGIGGRDAGRYAGIGAAQGAQINISGGTVTAIADLNGSRYGNFGIGGKNPTNLVITISGGTIKATGASGIGGETKSGSVSVVITGGTVDATGLRAGLGNIGPNGTVTISGGTVTAQGNNVGVGNIGPNGIVNISGGTVNATGSSDDSAGLSSIGSNGTVTISGGTVTANGGRYGCDIGSSDCTTTISGGTVDTIGGSSQSDIKGAFSTGNGHAVILVDYLGNQPGSDQWRGMIFQGVTGSLYGISFTMGEDVTIPRGNHLFMKDGQSLNIPAGLTLTVEGRIYKYGGTVGGSGNIVHPENIFPVRYDDMAYGNVIIGGTSDSCGNSCKGHVIFGTTDKYSVTVLGGQHDIELRDVNINNSNSSSCAFALSGNATVNLTLVGTSTLKSADNYAGLKVAAGSTLNITEKSTGTLIAIGGYYGAGIGGDFAGGVACQPGTINIRGGWVNATGGTDAAGIGGGWGCTGGTISIYSGSTVYATGGAQGAGIGGGDEGKDGGSIDISGSTVHATGGKYGAGIGGGYYGAGGSINISASNVTAKGGDYGAGIGGGRYGEGGTINIYSGSTVHATGGYCAAGIGGGDHDKGGVLYIYSGSDVTAIGGDYAAGIGGGYRGGGDLVRIYGSTVRATGGYYAAGIGGGGRDMGTAPSGGYIEISGGTVTASGGERAAGIGGGGFQFGTDSYGGSAGNILINGSAVIFVTKTSESASYIGPGTDNSNGSVSLTGGIIFEGDSSSGTFYGSQVTLCAPVTLPSGRNLTVPSGKTLVIPENITLTNYATLFLNGGTIDGGGKIDGNGTCKIAMVDSDIPTIPNQVHMGSPVEPVVLVTTTHRFAGKDFTVDAVGLTTRYENNRDVGTASMVFTKGSSVFRRNFEIVASSTTFDSIYACNDTGSTTKFFYGDIITVKAKPKATGTAASAFSLVAPIKNQMALYLGDVQISEPVGPDSNGVYTMTYDTAGKTLNVGRSTITAKYTGNDTMAGASGDLSITLLPKPLPSATVTGGSSISHVRVYDGGSDFVNVSLNLTGVLGGDIVTATASGTTASADAGTHAFTATGTALSGADARYYTLDHNAVEPGSAGILPKPVTVTVTAQNKVYNGTTTAPVTYAVIGKVGTDDVVATGTANFDNKNVGNPKTVNLSNLSLSGTKAGNYTLPNTTGTATAAITARPIAWNEAGTVATKTYNGSTTAAVDKTPTLIGVIPTDDVAVKNGTVAFANANVGTHAITATGFGIEGAGKDNYIAPTGQPAFATGTITQKAVISPNISITSSHTFNGKQQIPTFTVKDDKSVIPATNYTVSYVNNINAGTGTMEVTFKGNYSGGGSATFGIAKATTSSSTVTEPILMTAGAETAYSIPLPEIGNAGAVTYKVGTPTGDNIFSAVPKVEGKNLKFSNASGAIDGQSSQVTITIQSENYNDFTLTLTFTMTGKITVTLTGLSAQNSTYTGQPQKGFGGTLSITGATLTADDLAYTYIGISGTEYSPSNIAPTKAGSYKLTIAVPDGNKAYTGSHKVITFTIAKAPITVEQGSYTVTKVWDGKTTAGTPGGALSVSGILNSEAVTVTPTLHDYPSDHVSSSHSVIVDLALSGTDSGNYALASSTITVPGIITQATDYTGIQPSAPALAAANEVSVRLQTVTVEDETVEYAMGTTDAAPDTGWQTGTDFGGLTAATTYYFFARVAANGNHGVGTPSAGTAIPTAKKVFEETEFPNVGDGGGTVPGAALLEPRSFLMTNGAAESADFAPSDALGSYAPTGAAFTKVTGPANPRVMESVTIKNGALAFTSRKNPVGFAATDLYTITVSSNDYQDFAFTMAFSAVEKLTATITATVASKAYDGKAVAQPIPTATSGGSAVTLNYTYQWQKDGAPIADAPKDVGNYALVIKGENGNSVGSRTIPFTIDKQALTITAQNKSILAGTNFTAQYYTVAGLAEKETLTGVKVTCSYKNDNSASSLAGQYPITVSGGNVSGGNGNYAITYLPATLTVTLDITALNAAIKAAETLKSSVELLDKTPSEVENGKQFVTSEAVTALENVITAAKQVAGTALPTSQELAAAMSALAQASETFKAAIQTGSYGVDSVTRYAITATADKGGSISPKGTVRVQRGTDKVFTITPDEGYVIADVLVDGVSVGGVSSYTFQKVTKPHTISATFRLWVNPYSDVTEKDWFYKDVQAVTQRNLMSGVGAGRFDPHGTATRATIAAVLYRQAGSPEVKTDGTAWYSSAQAWGIAAGVCDGTNMERTITRQELVTMLHRYAKQLKIDVSVGEDTNILSYNDALTLPQWSIPAFQWACGSGIVSGANENLHPTAPATRAEVAAMLQRFLTLTAK